jgi:hypothetical protein
MNKKLLVTALILHFLFIMANPNNKYLSDRHELSVALSFQIGIAGIKGVT